MLYADDAGVVSQAPEQLKKTMGVIVVVCMAFGLTVSEAKTEIMCLRAKGMPESTAVFSVEAAGQVYNQTNEFLYLGENVNHNADLSIEVDQRMRNAWCSFRKYTLELYDRASAALELKRYSRQCCTAASYGARALASTTQCAEPSTGFDSLHLLAKAQSHRPPDSLSGYAYQDRKRENRGDFTQEADRVRGICGAHAGYETAKVPDVRRDGGGRGLCGGVRKKSGRGVSWTTSEVSASTPTSRRLQPRTRGNSAGRRNKRGNIS